MITVLVMSSSPLDQGPLHLGKEHKIVKHSLDSSLNRDNFKIVQNPSTTIDDLRRYLVEHSPTIVHFSGHGAGEPGLCFEDDDGNTHMANADQLAKLFHIVSDNVKCVVLNACLSEAQAKAISEHIDFVVGMRAEIGDLAALKFAQGFYEGVWAGVSYEKAFKLGCSSIDTSHLPEEHIPVFLQSPRLGGQTLAYSEDTQKLENFFSKFFSSPHEDRRLMSLPSAMQTYERDSDEVDYTRQKGISVTVQSTKTVAKVYKEVRLLLRHGLDTQQMTAHVKPHEGNYLLDRAATVGYWPIPYTTYKSLGVGQPITVRVTAQLGSYYLYGFDRDHHIAVELYTIDRDNLTGYVPKAARYAGELVGILFDGKKHRISVKIFPGKGSNSTCHILELVSDSWVIADPSKDPAAPKGTDSMINPAESGS
jgi:hypothetical protein